VLDPPDMAGEVKAVGVLTTTYDILLEGVEQALANVPDERIVSISYSTTRILGIWLRHHALIVIREG
jgi:hypothetical protein